MSNFTFLRLAVAMLMLSFVSACGRAPLAGPAVRGSQAIAARAVTTFQATSIAQLAGHAADPAYEGRLVRVEASFDRHTYVLDYGRTYRGYRLWDHDAHALLCQNVYSLSTLSTGLKADDSRDLSSEAASRLLSPGVFAKLEGKFHTAHTGASHGGVFEVPASLDVYTIDGRPTHELVRL